MSATHIKTKYGNARLNRSGHYVITSGKEGNHNKLLHRLIFEDFYQIELPEDIVVHHHDGDKTNNNIWNLIPMTKGEHISYHTKLREYSEESRYKQGKSKSCATNKTGYFRVSKRIRKNAKRVSWRYLYVKDGKRKEITSNSISKLKEKVLAKGLEWTIVDEKKAGECEDN